MNEQEYRKILQDAGLELTSRGLAVGSAGNISLVMDDNTFLCSPTGSSLGHLNVDDISRIDVCGNLLSGKKPTKEYKFHLAIYEKNKNIKAVVHLHSIYSTAYSCLSDLNVTDAIRPITPYVVMKLGPVHVVPYFKPGSDLIASHISPIADKTNAFLLANHGMIVGGKSMSDAINNALELEDTCKLYFLTRGCNLRYLTQDEISELR